MEHIVAKATVKEHVFKLLLHYQGGDGYNSPRNYDCNCFQAGVTRKLEYAEWCDRNMKVSEPKTFISPNLP